MRNMLLANDRLTQARRATSSASRAWGRRVAHPAGRQADTSRDDVAADQVVPSTFEDALPLPPCGPSASTAGRGPRSAGSHFRGKLCRFPDAAPGAGSAVLPTSQGGPEVPPEAPRRALRERPRREPQRGPSDAPQGPGDATGRARSKPVWKHRGPPSSRNEGCARSWNVGRTVQSLGHTRSMSPQFGRIPGRHQPNVGRIRHVNAKVGPESPKIGPMSAESSHTPWILSGGPPKA